MVILALKILFSRYSCRWVFVYECVYGGGLFNGASACIALVRRALLGLRDLGSQTRD